MVSLLDAYARDPAGGAEALSAYARENLVRELAARPQAFSVLAFDGDSAGGSGELHRGFFHLQVPQAAGERARCGGAGQPPRPRRGRADAWQVAEREALRRGAVKMTLEVLSGNRPALRLYERIGYAGYQLDPAMGTAQFMQKWL
jgi:hypothetical protein